jgi:hypothetical protein
MATLKLPFIFYNSLGVIIENVSSSIFCAMIMEQKMYRKSFFNQISLVLDTIFFNPGSYRDERTKNYYRKLITPNYKPVITTSLKFLSTMMVVSPSTTISSHKNPSLSILIFETLNGKP